MGLTIITSTSFFSFFSFTYSFGYRACIQHRERERHRTHTTHTERDTVSPRPEDVKEDIEFLWVWCMRHIWRWIQSTYFIHLQPPNQDCVSLPHTQAKIYIPKQRVRSFVRSFVTKSEKFSLPIQFQSVRQVCLTRCHSTDGSGPTRQSFYFFFSFYFFLAVIKNWCTRERESGSYLVRWKEVSKKLEYLVSFHPPLQTDPFRMMLLAQLRGRLSQLSRLCVLPVDRTREKRKKTTTHFGCLRRRITRLRSEIKLTRNLFPFCRAKWWVSKYEKKERKGLEDKI